MPEDPTLGQGKSCNEHLPPTRRAFLWRLPLLLPRRLPWFLYPRHGDAIASPPTSTPAVHALQLLSLIPLLPLAALAIQLTCGRRWPSGRGRPPTYYRRLHISDSHPGQVVAPLLSRGPGLAQGVACFGPGLWLAPRPRACQGHPLQKAQRPGQRSSRGPLCLLVLRAVQAGIAWGRDVCLDSTLLAAWSHQDPDAAWSYLSRKGRVFGYKVHTLLDRTSRLPLFFLVTPANRHDLPWPMGCCGWPRIGCCCL